MSDERGQPFVQAMVEPLVGRQHQKVRRQHVAKRDARLKPLLHRVSFGLKRVDAYVRRNPRQYLVTRDDHLQLRTIKTCVFRRVTTTNNNPPDAATNIDVLTVANPVIACWKVRDVCPK